MLKTQRTGLYLALATAGISGLSIYLNKYAVMGMDDAVLFATLKNTLVGAVFVIILAISLRRASPGERLSLRQCLGLAALAAVGGSLPFILFFTGLATASAPSAALIHKSLFLWVAMLAVPLLNEKLNNWAWLGLGLLAVGQILGGWPKTWGWGQGETMILVATLLWALETLIAKRILAHLGAVITATARMAGGALVMWLFLIVENRASAVLTLSAANWLWVFATAALLAAYVATWYAALKRAPAVTVTSLLTLGAIITAVITLTLEGRLVSVMQIAGLTALAIGNGVLLSRALAKPRAVLSSRTV